MTYETIVPKYDPKMCCVYNNVYVKIWVTIVYILYIDRGPQG